MQSRHHPGLARGLLLAVLTLLACGRTEVVDLELEEEPPADGGLDAGRADDDAGALDAGALDAGTPDGGAPDAGRPDAGCQGIEFETVTATLVMTAQSRFRLWFNGALIDDIPRPWNVPQRYALPLRTHPRAQNLLAVEVTVDARANGLDRGLIADLSWPAQGTTRRLLTDVSWRAQNGTTPPAGWQGFAFDDAPWPRALVIASHGAAPWGPVLNASSANWLWTYLPSGSAGTKPPTERVLFRRAFSLDASGEPVSPAGPCR